MNRVWLPDPSRILAGSGSLAPWMKELTETLLSTQRDGFSYPWGAVDLSNTQYGVLGLRAAALHDVKVPPEALGAGSQITAHLG